ncbi:MAG: tetratricopeptide repeat protein [Acidobacteriota bacterium]|jgi:thioredoxin-like negative regulator of GroEL
MVNRRSLFLVLVLGAAITPLLAQDVPIPKGMKIGIQGEVRYAQGGRPAENVLVRLEAFSGGLVDQVRTDRTGKFSFLDIGQAIYRVTASIVGFRTVTQEVNLTTTPNEHLIFTLVPDKAGQENRIVPGADSIIDTKVPKEARDEYEKGRTALLNGTEPAKGIPHLESAVKIYPDFLQAQLLLGTAYFDMHQMDKAESALKRVLEIDPKTTQALFALGELYRTGKRYPEAEKALQQGLQWNDASWQGHLALGRLYLDTGNIAKAGAEIGRALQLKPDNPETYLFAGNVLLKANRAEEALQMFEQYLHLAPKGQYADETQKIVEKIKKVVPETKK